MDQRARIREEIEEARISLADKLAAIDERARDRFSEVRSRAKNAITVRHQVRQHPFMVLGLAVAAGWVVSRMLRARGRTTAPVHRAGGISFRMGGERGIPGERARYPRYAY
ncbi:MAG TPA: hypothetical protein VFG83_17985 [Kofleriaceae bacterium]|nr:hypothetical protein [Kofleriaceae bacterium]